MAAFDRLRRIFRDEYGAYLHPLPNERLTPGALVDAYWGSAFPVDTDPDLGPSSTYAWTWIDRDEGDFPVSGPLKAGIFNGTLTDSIELSGAISLPQIGLSVDGSVSDQYHISVDIQEVSLRTFERGPDFTRLRQQLLALEDTDKTYYRAVKDDFLVSDSYHVSRATLSFESKAGGKAEAEFSNAGMKIGGSVEAKWNQKGDKLTFEGPIDVPIALAGKRVKRTCFLFWCGR